MKTKCNFPISFRHHSFSKACMVMAFLLSGALAGSAQTGRYVYEGYEQTITLGPGIYDITAYGAQGGSDNYADESGGLGAEMEGQFSFTSVTTLILLVGGVGGLSTDAEFGTGAGGGGGSFVIDGSTPLVIAGGGGGAGQGSSGANTGTSGSDGGFLGDGGAIGFGSGGINGGGGGSGITQGGNAGGGGGYSGDGGGVNGGQSFLSGGAIVSNGGFGGGGGGGGGSSGGAEGGGGGGYSGGGGGGAGVYNPDFGGGGGGGGSYIDSSAIAIITEESGVTIPDDPGYGEIFITAVPEPTTLALAGLGGLSLFLFRRRSAN